jgi:hypothetical protein
LDTILWSARKAPRCSHRFHSWYLEGDSFSNIVLTSILATFHMDWANFDAELVESVFLFKRENDDCEV